MAHVVLEKTALSRTLYNRKILEQILEKNPVLYGINTGFGALSNQRIPKEDLAQLQVNLLRSQAGDDRASCCTIEQACASPYPRDRKCWSQRRPFPIISHGPGLDR